MSVKPIRDSVVFTFVQHTRDGYFRRETDWGFTLAGSDYESSKPRWGLVEMVGPECKHVTPGEYILIEPLKWTTAVEVEGKKYWRTAEPFVMLTTSDKPTNLI